MISQVTDELTTLAQQAGELLGYKVEELRDFLKVRIGEQSKQPFVVGEIKAEVRRRFEAGENTGLMRALLSDARNIA